MDKKEIIAIDIGGTNTRIAVVKNNKIVKLIKYNTPKSKNLLLKTLFKKTASFLNEKTKGIGIGCPGPLKDGIILNPPNIPLKNINLKKAFQEKFHLRTEIENDAKCAAMAEKRFGMKKNNFVLLTLGTGIGGGVYIDGKLFQKENLGSELGSNYLEKNKTFEDIASGKIISKNKNNKIKITELEENLARGIGSLINIFNSDVILTGGITKNGDGLLKRVRKKVKKYILLPGKYQIYYSKLPHPGILGASLLIN